MSYIIFGIFTDVENWVTRMKTLRQDSFIVIYGLFDIHTSIRSVLVT